VDSVEAEFNAWPELSELMPFNSGAIITSRDNLAIDFDRSVLLEKIERFASSAKGDKRVEQEIGYSVKAKWDVEACKRSIRNDRDRPNRIRKILYRPFDERFIFYSSALLDTPSKPVSNSIFGCDNLVLLTPKVKTSETFNHALVSRLPAEKKACSHDRATQMFPLYRCDSELAVEPEPNLRGRAFSSVSAPQYFGYVYAILYSPTYRLRYGNAIRDSYPRIPVVEDAELFRTLARLGGELTALHLLESPKLAQPITEFIGGRHPEVEKISWSKNTVSIDKAQTTGFRGVREEVWKFHIGGYQVCEKWLKDRKGRTLSKADIAHNHKIVIALSETIRLMAEIDKVIEKHGGWPGAFVGSAG
jgi:predicted helicase